MPLKKTEQFSFECKSSKDHKQITHHDLKKVEEKIIRKLNMLVSQITQMIIDLKNQLIKAKDEIIARITVLENAETDAAFDAAASDLRDTVQKLDDIIPDAAPGTTTNAPQFVHGSQTQTQADRLRPLSNSGRDYPNRIVGDSDRDQKYPAGVTDPGYTEVPIKDPMITTKVPVNSPATNPVNRPSSNPQVKK